MYIIANIFHYIFAYIFREGVLACMLTYFVRVHILLLNCLILGFILGKRGGVGGGEMIVSLLLIARENDKLVDNGIAMWFAFDWEKCFTKSYFSFFQALFFWFFFLLKVINSWTVVEIGAEWSLARSKQWNKFCSNICHRKKLNKVLCHLLSPENHSNFSAMLCSSTRTHTHMFTQNIISIKKQRCDVTLQDEKERSEMKQRGRQLYLYNASLSITNLFCRMVVRVQYFHILDSIPSAFLFTVLATSSFVFPLWFGFGSRRTWLPWVTCSLWQSPILKCSYTADFKKRPNLAKLT